MPSIWNKSAHEWECSECGCWSPLDHDCWYCAENRRQQRIASSGLKMTETELAEAINLSQATVRNMLPGAGDAAGGMP